MNDCGTTRDAVRRWPDDPAEKRALEEYFDALTAAPNETLRVLRGGGLDFRGANLSALYLTEAAFDEANLNGVSMVGADLYGAWLNSADLRGADLSKADLRKAMARGYSAREAILREADFSKSDFDDSDFRQADLRRGTLANAMFDVDLRGADLRDCHFGQNRNSVNLGGARLSGSRLDGATGLIYGTVNVGNDEPDHWRRGTDSVARRSRRAGRSGRSITVKRSPRRRIAPVKSTPGGAAVGSHLPSNGTTARIVVGSR